MRIEIGMLRQIDQPDALDQALQLPGGLLRQQQRLTTSQRGVRTPGLFAVSGPAVRHCGHHRPARPWPTPPHDLGNRLLRFLSSKARNGELSIEQSMDFLHIHVSCAPVFRCANPEFRLAWLRRRSGRAANNQSHYPIAAEPPARCGSVADD